MAKLRLVPTPQQRNARAESNLDLVRKIALFLMKRLPASIEYDDLYQSGCIGLLRAAELYDPSTGVPFRVYASTRVKGAMLDSIRRNEWRNANHLPITEDVLDIPAPIEDVTRTIEHGERARLVAESAEGIADKSARVIDIYFWQEQKLAGVGREFGVRQSRSSQLLRTAKCEIERELSYRGLRRVA